MEARNSPKALTSTHRKSRVRPVHCTQDLTSPGLLSSINRDQQDHFQISWPTGPHQRIKSLLLIFSPLSAHPLSHHQHQFSGANFIRRSTSASPTTNAPQQTNPSSVPLRYSAGSAKSCYSWTPVNTPFHLTALGKSRCPVRTLPSLNTGKWEPSPLPQPWNESLGVETECMSPSTCPLSTTSRSPSLESPGLESPPTPHVIYLSTSTL